GGSTRQARAHAAQAVGSGVSVTVHALDANWHLVSSTHTVGMTATDPNDTNPANASLSAGTGTFALTFKSAGSWTVTATDITDGTRTANTSPSNTRTADAFTKLQMHLPGEIASPGSSTDKTGTPIDPTAGMPPHVS